MQIRKAHYGIFCKIVIFVPVYSTYHFISVMRFKDILTFHSVPARTLLLEEGQVADTFFTGS